MDCAGAGLGAQQIGGADLHAGGAQSQGGGHPLRVGYAAGGDHRDLHRLDDLRQQGKGADLGAQILREEHAAMAPRFQTLGDDGIDATLLKPERLFNGGGRRQDLGAPAPHPLQQLRRWQSEMKAQHRRLEGLEH